MGTMRGQIVGNATRLFDLFLLICCFTLATLRHLGKGQPRSLAQFLSLRIKLEDLVIFATLLLLWHLSFAMHGLYRSKRLASRRGEALDVFRATSLCALILALASWVLDFQWVTPGFVVIFWVCATVTIAASRITIRTLLRRIRQHGRDLRNMLLVGSNRRTLEFAKRIQAQPELGCRLIGFADVEWAGMAEFEKHGLSRLCDLDNLRMFLRRSVVDEVVLTIPLRSFHDLATSVAGMCQEQGIVLRVLPDLFDLKEGNPQTEEIHGATADYALQRDRGRLALDDEAGAGLHAFHGAADSACSAAASDHGADPADFAGSRFSLCRSASASISGCSASLNSVLW